MPTLLQYIAAAAPALEQRLVAVLGQGAEAVRLRLPGACTVGTGAGLYSAELQLLVAAAVHRLELLDVLQLPETGSALGAVLHLEQLASPSAVVGRLEGTQRGLIELDIVWMLFQPHCLASLPLSHTAAHEQWFVSRESTWAVLGRILEPGKHDL